MNVIQQAAALVSDPPASLVYHLVLLFALGAAAAVALGQWRLAAPVGGVGDAARGRLTLAACLLFVLRLLALASAILAALGILDPLVAAPPFERAVSALTIIIVIWFLAFPQPLRLADAVIGLMGILVALGLAISWGLWYQQAPLAHYYNGSPQETAWEAAQLVLLVAAAIVLAWRRRADWLIGLAIVSLLLAAHLIHYLYTIAQSNVSGMERLFEIVVVPLIAATIIRRALWPLPAVAHSILSESKPPAEGSPEPNKPVARPDRPPRAGIDSRTAVALASMGNASDLAALAQSATLGVAHTLPAPATLLLAPVDGAFKVTCVYDQQRQRYVDMLLPVLSDRPEIVQSLGDDTLVLWTLSDKEAELRAFAFELGLQTEGPVVLMPIRLPGSPLLGALGALPATGQAGWSADQYALLKALALPIAQAWQAVTARTQPVMDTSAAIAERDETRREGDTLR